jgi:hypothetical protein
MDATKSQYRKPFDTDSHLHSILTKYMEWLNLWFARDRELYSTSQPPDLTFDDFFQYPGETELHGQVKVGENTVYVFSAGYGDDGGPSTITATWDGTFDHILSIVQEFDLSTSVIFEYSGFKATPQDQTND